MLIGKYVTQDLAEWMEQRPLMLYAFLVIVALSKVKINQYYHVLFVQQAGTKLHQHNQFVQHVKKVSILLQTTAKQLTTHERTSVYRVNQVVHFQLLRLNVQYVNRVGINLKSRMHQQVVLYAPQVFH